MSQYLYLVLVLLACFWIKESHEDEAGNVTTTTMTPSAGNASHNVTSLCVPVETDHTCHLSPDVNSMYQFPQNIPTIFFSSRSVKIAFTFLITLLPPDDCSVAFQRITCIGATPPCNPESGLLLPICPSSCNAYSRLSIEGICDEVFEFARQIQEQSNLEDFQFFLELLLNFDCYNRSTYSFYGDEEVDPNHCIEVFRPGQAEQILSRPNLCVASPSPLCNHTIGRTGYFLPLSRREDETIIEYLYNLFEGTNNTCKDVFLNLACYYQYPPCDPVTGNAIPVCTESGDVFTALLNNCLSVIDEDNPSLVLEIRNLTINYSDPFSYLYPFVFIDNTMCVNASDLEESLNPIIQVTTSVPNPDIVIGNVVPVLVVFIVIATVVVLAVIIFKNCKTGKQFSSLRERATNRMTEHGRPYSLEPGVNQLAIKNVDTSDDAFTLSEADRTSYEKVFSSILVPFASLTVGEDIGQGAFGKVYHGEMLMLGANPTKEEVAIKTIKHLRSREEVEAFFAESFVMKDFKHPNVLSLTGVCFDTPDGIPYIILPYMANGSLKDYLKRNRVHVTDVDTIPEDLNMSILVKMCLEIAQGMQYLSGMKFVHRDLAARNCMVDINLTIKVGDFGLARDVYSSDYYRANKNTKVPVKWMPPETLHDGISNEMTDVWSYGVTCWEVFSLGRAPYPGIENQDILKQISCGERLDRPTLCPKMLYDMIMYKCWELRPEDRPSFDDLVQQLLEYWEEEHAYVIE